MDRLIQLKYLGFIAALSLALSACASSTPKPLDEAQMSYSQAEKSHASEYAPTELQQAKRSLDRAEKIYDDKGDSEESRTMAYLAQREAQQAMATAELNYLASTRKARENQLFAQTDAQRRDYQQQLQEQRHQSDIARELSEQQLQQQRDELQSAMDELDDERSNSADMAQLREQYQESLDQLDAEIQRREDAEERMSQMSDRLAEIGDIRQSSEGTVVSLSSATLFEINKSELLPAAQENLEKLAEALKDDSEINLSVAGFTSSTGPREFNQRLSEQRADAVKDFLVSQGIDAARINTAGYGEDQPVATNDTQEGRAMNRRVEITVEPGEAIGGGPEDSSSDDDFEGQQQPQIDDQGIQESPLPPVDELPGDSAEPAEGDDADDPDTRREEDRFFPEDSPSPGMNVQPGESSRHRDRDSRESDEDEDSPDNIRSRDRVLQPGVDDDDGGIRQYEEPIDEF